MRFLILTLIFPLEIVLYVLAGLTMLTAFVILQILALGGR